MGKMDGGKRGEGGGGEEWEALMAQRHSWLQTPKDRETDAARDRRPGRERVMNMEGGSMRETSPHHYRRRAGRGEEGGGHYFPVMPLCVRADTSWNYPRSDGGSTR